MVSAAIWIVSFVIVVMFVIVLLGVLGIGSLAIYTNQKLRAVVGGALCILAILVGYWITY